MVLASTGKTRRDKTITLDTNQKLAIIPRHILGELSIQNPLDNLPLLDKQYRDNGYIVCNVENYDMQQVVEILAYIEHYMFMS